MNPSTLLLVTFVVVVIVIWSLSISISLIYDPIKFQQAKCPACNFSPLKIPTSTERDVVLAAALNQLKRVEYFIRTLRTTGSRARIILFLDNKLTITNYWRRFFSACQVQPVYINNLNSVIQSAPKLSRYYFEFQWLSLHINEYDRVLHTDTFDVIFQSDPFADWVDPSKLYFSLEPVSLKNSIWTSKWIEQCYGKETVIKYKQKPVSCSGVTVGGAAPFLQYLQILLNSSKWNTCFGHSLDQAHHNYLWYSGEFEKNGLIIEGLDCNSEYLTMHFCCKIGHCFYNQTSNVLFGNKSNLAPILVHQYNRWKNLTQRNQVMCPSSKKGIFAATRYSPLAPIYLLPPLRNIEFPSETLWPPEHQK